MDKTTPRVGFISLGCPKATVDSERILTRLRAEGYAIVPSYADADLVVVNTCGFIDAAVEESLQAIGEALAENGKVIVTGCLGGGERAEQVRERHPQVLAVTGPHALEEVMAALHEHLPPPHAPWESLIPPQGIRLTPRHYAYLKIAEGCSHGCTFCIIPQLRGPLHSRPFGEVMQEAENLANAGVQELLVVAQDTAAFGLDVKYRTGFWNGRPVKSDIAHLADALGELGIWVRLHYLYPYPHIDRLVERMADGTILPYLDVPLQHASPTVLKAMKRPAASENMRRRIAHWRESCPDLTLRSTFVVGFPGETEDDFQALLDFVAETGFDRLGAFAYSPVEGAAANALPAAVPEAVREERLQRLMALQEEISAGRLAARVGEVTEVVIDEVLEDGLLARSRAEAPEVDGVVSILLDDTEGFAPGDRLEVEIIASDAHDLEAQPLDPL